MRNIALLGLGIMGSGMAGNLLKAGFALTVYNRTRSKAEPFAAQGARVAATPAEAAKGAECVISMVSDDVASWEMWLGPNGALDAASPDAVLIECSTLSLGWIRALKAQADARNLALLDAPVGGSKGAAAEGSLTFFVGGPEEVLQRAQPVFDAMGKRTLHFGASGNGLTMKLINNLMGAVQVANLGEALALAEQSGLDVAKVAEALASGAPGSPVVRMKAWSMVHHEYADTQFALRWMRKDLGYALAIADELSVPTPIVAIARQIYRMAGNLGLDDADWAAVAEAVRLPKR